MAGYRAGAGLRAGARARRSAAFAPPSTGLGTPALNVQSNDAGATDGFNPNEPRDQDGRWTGSGGGAFRSGGWLDRSPEAKALVGDAARVAGVVPGFARGVWHTGRDALGSAYFALRLADPLDAKIHPRGEAAWDKVFQAGKQVADYTASRFAHPGMVADDVAAGLDRFRVELDPSASPPAPTFAGEAARNFNVGLNRGEALFTASMLFGGAAELKALTQMGRFSEAATAAKYLRRGYPPEISEYFATPYKGVGHHFLPRRTGLPPWLGGGPVPPAISDSPFFRLKPPGVSTGDFYERHFQVDPHYFGGKVPAEFRGPRGWSGRSLGWKKYGRAARLWHGSPAPLKAAVGAGAAGLGAGVDQVWNGERQP